MPSRPSETELRSENSYACHTAIRSQESDPPETRSDPQSALDHPCRLDSRPFPRPIVSRPDPSRSPQDPSQAVPQRQAAIQIPRAHEPLSWTLREKVAVDPGLAANPRLAAVPEVRPPHSEP